MSPTTLMKNCDRLNGKNYRSWKVQMMLHLKDAKLWDVVKVTEVTTGTRDEIEKWNIRSEEAGVKIMLCINAELLDLVEGEEHGFKVWMKLKEYYEATNMPNQRFFQQKLHSLRYDSFPGMEEYLLAALQIKNDLAATGFKVDDTNCVDFNYAVSSGKLLFRATILQRFDEEITNDVLVLASHFNGLLNFGTVKVSVKYNYVEFVYSRDLLTYSLFPGEINTDTDIHFNLTQYIKAV